MKPHHTSAIVFVLLTLSVILSACGPSPEQVYLEKLNAPITAYNAKFDAFTAIELPDNLDAPDWEAKIITALDELDKAAVDLGAVAGEAPESCAALDGYVTEIASNTSAMTNSFRDLITEAKNFTNEVNQQNTFFEAVETLTTIYGEKIFAASTIFEIPDNPADPEWQSKSAVAITELEQAANNLGNIQNIPESFVSINEALKKIPTETNTLTKSMREMMAYFAAGDNNSAMAKMQEISALYQNIGNLLTQIDTSSIINSIPSDEALNAKLKETEDASSKLTELIGKANAEVDRLSPE
jgi:hypothetical protein